MRFIFLCILSIFVMSCTGQSDRVEIGGDSAVTYTGSGFSVMIPHNWNASGTIDTLPIPAHGTVVLATVSSETKYGFANNFLILRDSLNTLMSSKLYSEMNSAQTYKKYLEYTPVTNEPILFGDDDESRVYVFDAKYNTQTPRMRFIQTAKVCGTHVYLLHISIPLDRESHEYINLMRTFSCWW